MFFVSQYRNFRGWNLFFSLISGVENFKHKRRVSLFSVEHILSHITKYISYGNPSVNKKISILEVFLDKKDLEGGGEYHNFLSFIFCLTIPNFSRVKPFFSLISGVENFKHKRRISRFSVEHILSHITKFFRMGNLLWIWKFLFSKIFLDEKDLEGGSITIFSPFFCLTVSKGFAGKPFSVSQVPGIEKKAKPGFIKILCWSYFASQYQKLVKYSLCVSELFWYQRFCGY